MPPPDTEDPVGGRGRPGEDDPTGDVAGAVDGSGGEDATDVPTGDGEDGTLAPAEALARARAAAKAKGLRPGLKPRRRTKDLPDGRRGAARGGRDPQLLGDQIDRFVTERGWAADVAVGSVIGRWPAIVGPDIASHSHPTDFVDGVLTVRADSTAWATQLRLLESSLMGRLAEEVGEGTVQQLKVVGPSAPSWSRGRHRAQDGRGPRDTYG